MKCLDEIRKDPTIVEKLKATALIKFQDGKNRWIADNPAAFQAGTVQGEFWWTIFRVR